MMEVEKKEVKKLVEKMVEMMVEKMVEKMKVETVHVDVVDESRWRR